VHAEEQTNGNSLDLAGINFHVGLKRVNGNMELYRSLLFNFGDKYKDFKKELSEVIGRDDYERAIFLAHTLKGVAGNIGAQEVFECSKTLEAALKAGVSNEVIKSECKNLSLKLSQVIDVINEYQNRILAEKPVPAENIEEVQISLAEKKELAPRLKELYQLLAAGSADSIRIVEEIREKSGNIFDQYFLNDVEQCIKTYDFESAISKLKKLLHDLKVEFDQR
jgi:HPt (histidine-containing phosphotransfer) domain-containing protein